MVAASSASDSATADHDPQDLEGGHDAVARCRVLEQDDVAALLAAEDGSRHLHPLEDVLVTDGGPDDLAAGPLDDRLEAPVREDRHDQPAARQRVARQPVEGKDPEHLIAVDDPPGRIDRDEPVGVAVEGETRVRSGCDDGLGERAQAPWRPTAR